jgi:glutamyl-tRNA synthetase
LLARLKAPLAAVEPFDPPGLEAAVRAFIAAQQIGLGDIIHALRVAITGDAVGFGLYDALAILGRERCLARIERAISLI